MILHSLITRSKKVRENPSEINFNKNIYVFYAYLNINSQDVIHMEN